MPYEKLKEMDEINPTIDDGRRRIVVGANDVVNPVARTDPKSPIAGMPIIDVDKARTVIVIKRSPESRLRRHPEPACSRWTTRLMFFDDGKKAFVEIIQAVKEI